MLRPPPKHVVCTHSAAQHTAVQGEVLGYELQSRANTMRIALHRHSSAASGPGDHRLPTGSGRVMVQPLSPTFPPTALLLVESSQQMIAALRRASACVAQLLLAPRPGICTKLYVRQPLWAAGPSLCKAQLCSKYSSITQGKSSTSCERHQRMH